MDPEAVQTQEAPLTVNEQVIVMSSHETIRVLEVGVDAPPPAEEDRKPSEMPPGEGARGSPRGSSDPGREEVPPSTETSCSTETAGKTKPAAGASPSSGPPSGTFGHAASQQPQPLAPLAAPQYCRSSGRSAGAGCVDISYSNGRCPSRTDGCFSYRGNFQTTYSQSASRCRPQHGDTGPGAACPAAAGRGAAPAPPPAAERVPPGVRRAQPAPHPAAARCSAHAARGEAA